MAKGAERREVTYRSIAKMKKEKSNQHVVKKVIQDVEPPMIQFGKPSKGCNCRIGTSKTLLLRSSKEDLHEEGEPEHLKHRNRPDQLLPAQRERDEPYAERSACISKRAGCRRN